MLSKVSIDNISYGTDQIKQFAKTHNFDIVMDNLNGQLLVKDKSDIYIWNYKSNKINKRCNHCRIKLEFSNEYIFKQIDSFNQNNIKQSKEIRKIVLNYCKTINNSNNIIGIGGEYYLYFHFLVSKYKNFCGISNHKSIIEDANYNCFYSKNTLVDYNKIISFPCLDKTKYYDVIINVVNIHENIIKYICNYNIKNIIIVSCKPLYTKIKMLEKYLILKKIKHVININSLINICLFEKIK
jgi:hypothetical protein